MFSRTLSLWVARVPATADFCCALDKSTELAEHERLAGPVISWFVCLYAHIFSVFLFIRCFLRNVRLSRGLAYVSKFSNFGTTFVSLPASNGPRTMYPYLIDCLM